MIFEEKMRKLSRILPVLATMVLLLGLVSVADAQGGAPRPPINVQATVTDERVTLTWQGNPGDYTVDGYRIERYEGHRSVWEVLVPFQPAANNTPGNNPNTLDYPDPATDSIVGEVNNLAAENEGIGRRGALSGHKVDGAITN